MAESVQFRWDRRRLNWFMGLMALIGMPGLLLVAESDWSVKALGVAWGAIFGYGCFALARRKRICEPVLIVSETGILDRRIAETQLPWTAIARVEEFDAENVPFVGLDFHDRRTALAGAKPIVRLLAPLHSLMRFPAVSINMGLLDGTDAELLAAINLFRTKHDRGQA